jgi:hypothetical protein
VSFLITGISKSLGVAIVVAEHPRNHKMIKSSLSYEKHVRVKEMVMHRLLVRLYRIEERLR